jgi:hypothetical protein
MDAIFSTGWLHYLGLIVMVYGIVLFRRGLWGGRNGERGLVRRGVEMLERLEGWRLTLVGLTLTGLGAAWFWDLRWLLVLTLGIGFAELHETTHVLRAWRWDGRTSARRTPSGPTWG